MEKSKEENLKIITDLEKLKLNYQTLEKELETSKSKLKDSLKSSELAHELEISKLKEEMKEILSKSIKLINKLYKENR